MNEKDKEAFWQYRQLQHDLGEPRLIPMEVWKAALSHRDEQIKGLVEALEMLINNPFREGTNSSNRLIELAQAALAAYKEQTK